MAGLRESLLAVALITCAAATGPPPVLWAKGYSFGRSESHPHAGVQTSDGGFLMVGDGTDYANQSVVQRQILVLKTSADGQLQWQQSLGRVGRNYGKFGIELGDGSFLVAGARSSQVAGGGLVLERVLYRLARNGALLLEQGFANQAAAEGRRDGFMCVAADGAHSVVATGFVGGENASTGYPDEPMFLIYGGRAFVMKLEVPSSPTDRFRVLFERQITASGFEASQGMRLYHDRANRAYAVSVAAADAPGNFQFGLASISESGALNWAKMFVAGKPPLHGHASHPYALAGDPSGYAIGGLAVIFDSQQVEQCQGRLAKVSSNGELLWDRRFTSSEPDTNIECYGLQLTADSGYIMTCGTGVEPELHPSDPDAAKTWRVLVHRTDRQGGQLWQKTYTNNTKPFRNNAGEYIVATREGEYAVFVDSQSYGSPTTGGNFAIIKLASDVSRGATRMN